MKRLLLCLLLLPALIRAQPITELAPWRIYPGVIAEKILVIPVADTNKVITAVLYNDRNTTAPLSAPVQPVVTKLKPREVLIRWAVTTNLPQTSYLKIRFDGLIRFGSVVSVSTQNVNTTDPRSLTILYPVSISLPDSGVPAGEVGTFKQYQYLNAVPGQPIIHGQFTRFVTGAAFQDDTGALDPLWRVEIQTENTVILRGPPGETFTGTLILTFYKRPTQ